MLRLFVHYLRRGYWPLTALRLARNRVREALL